jgi:uncharacterized membrane protein YhaH (DUF805 family)
MSEKQEDFRWSSMLRWDGTVGRGTYAFVGVFGFAVKHNLDRILASGVFGRPWGIFSYWIPLDRAIRITTLEPAEARFLLTMVAISLPFIYVGLAMTMRRLRSAGLPPGLLVLFFVPFVNLLFFVTLALVPERSAAPPQRNTSALHHLLDRMIPDHALGAATLSALVTGTLGTGLAVLSVVYLRDFGWSLFVALPFVMGMVAAILHGHHRPASAGGSIGVGVLSVTVLGVLLLALAVEGLVCVLMAAPIGLPMAGLGGFVGYLVQRRTELRPATPGLLLALLAAMPLLMGAEAADPQAPPLYEVVTVVEVAAPPDAVWQRVISFTPLPAPRDWMFRAGIAYPMRAEMHGTGVGAERHCVFSTGAFVEPIEVWDAPRRLKFSVTSNPAPMQEWTPYGNIPASHLEGFLVSEGGQFHLVPLEGGRTRVEATTWYHHGLWPAAYWRLWSDAIIHRIHLRVLEHVKQRSEAGLP